MSRPWGGRSLALAAAGLLLSGCGSGAASGAPPPPSSALMGHLTVFAAASLTEALQATDTELQREHPGLAVSPSFAGSQTLVAQILAGAPADLIATADQQSMRQLVAAGAVESPRIFARNQLAIVVAPGNPRGIHGLADLARPELAVVLADPTVPVGGAAAAVLRRQGVIVHPRSLELDVKAVLRRVVAGEADAGIVYVTDVSAAGASAAAVQLPASANVQAAYPVAVVRGSAHRAAAEAYLTELLHGAGHRALLARGFLPP